MRPKSIALLNALRDFVNEANQPSPSANGIVESIELARQRLLDEAELEVLRSIATELSKISRVLSRWDVDGMPAARDL